MTLEKEVAYRVEIRGIYDVWSIAVLRDGTLVNRWPEGDPRHAPTQKIIDEDRDYLSKGIPAPTTDKED